MRRTFRLSDSAPDPRRDVSDEVRFHLDMRTEELVERGMPPEEARRAALAAFGDVEAVEAECRTVRVERARTRRRREWRSELLGDLRYAARTLRRAPLFAAAAVLTLALGMAGAVAAFTLVNGVLLRPLPYADPARLAMVWMTGEGMAGPVADWPLSIPNYVDLEERTRAFAGIAAFRAWPYTLGGDGPGLESEIVAGSRVAPRLFGVLGVRPLLGRGFVADDAREGSARVAVIGHDLWRRRFGGEPGVVGRQVTLSGERVTVVGVMPRGFAFPRGAELPAGLQFRPRTELWTPLAFTPEELTQRGTGNLAAVARLAPGVTLDAARADLARVVRQLVAEHPRYFGPRPGMTAASLADQAAAPVRRGLLLLSGAVAVVLLIACANIANLLLARAAARDRELAVRRALGASRGRVLRQLVTENVLLALAGAAVGFAVAAAATRLLLARLPAGLPRADDVVIDARVVIATLAAAVLAGVAFGVLTTLHADGARPADAARGGGRATAGRARRLGRRLLVASEVALSLVLLVGAALLLRSYARLARVEPGFDPRGAMTASVLLPVGTTFDQRRDGARWAAFFDEYVGRLAALPGVEAAGGVSSLPLSGAVESSSFAIAGRPRPQPDQSPGADYNVVTPGYFRAARVPLLAGRTFDSRDRADGPPALVVSAALARRYWPGEPLERVVGQGVLLGFGGEGARRIVGVVGDVRQSALDAPPQPAMYLPESQFPYPFLSVVVRARAASPRAGQPPPDPAALLPWMRRELRAIDPALALDDVRPLQAVLDASISRQRFGMLVTGAFAAAALVLAMVGLYGVIAYGVVQRTRELGVRMALGASRRDVLAAVVGEGMTVVAAGLAVGLAAALAAARLLRGQLYDVSATDATIYGAVLAVTAAVALVATVLPARRAARLDPVAALRAE